MIKDFPINMQFHSFRNDIGVNRKKPFTITDLNS